jgi:hypothetical protein
MSNLPVGRFCLVSANETVRGKMRVTRKMLNWRGFPLFFNGFQRLARNVLIVRGSNENGRGPAVNHLRTIEIKDKGQVNYGLCRP